MDEVYPRTYAKMMKTAEFKSHASVRQKGSDVI